MASSADTVVRRTMIAFNCWPYRRSVTAHFPRTPSVLPPPRAPPKKTSGSGQSTSAFCGPCCGLQTHLVRGDMNRRPFIGAHWLVGDGVADRVGFVITNDCLRHSPIQPIGNLPDRGHIAFQKEELSIGAQRSGRMICFFTARKRKRFHPQCVPKGLLLRVRRACGRHVCPATVLLAERTRLSATQRRGARG